MKAFATVLATAVLALSTAAQAQETLDKHFAGQTGLWLAAVDLEAMGGAVQWEPSRGGQLFPHVYGDLPLNAVVAYSPLERDQDGTARLPIAS